MPLTFYLQSKTRAQTQLVTKLQPMICQIAETLKEEKDRASLRRFLPKPNELKLYGCTRPRRLFARDAAPQMCELRITSRQKAINVELLCLVLLALSTATAATPLLATAILLHLIEHCAIGPSWWWWWWWCCAAAAAYTYYTIRIGTVGCCSE